MSAGRGICIIQDVVEDEVVVLVGGGHTAEGDSISKKNLYLKNVERTRT